MAALMLAVAGVAWAEDCTGTFSPCVVRTSPVDNKTGFDRDANIKAWFSKRIDTDYIGFDFVRLNVGYHTWADINCAPGTVTCNAVEPLDPPNRSKIIYYHRSKKAALDWGERLWWKTTYTVVIEGAGDSDGFAVKDKAGNEMATDYIWHFKTGRR